MVSLVPGNKPHNRISIPNFKQLKKTKMKIYQINNWNQSLNMFVKKNNWNEEEEKFK